MSPKPARAMFAPRHIGMLRIELERDQPSVRRQRPRQPDRAIAGERADLEDAPGPDESRQQMRNLPWAGET